MLFYIHATEIVQLYPCDFHRNYVEVLKETLKDRLFRTVSYKYGKVIALEIPDATISRVPRLMPHSGVASFCTPFTAIIEKFVINEVMSGQLVKLTIEEGQDSMITYHFHVSTGTHVVSAHLTSECYRSISTERIEIVPLSDLVSRHNEKMLAYYKNTLHSLELGAFVTIRMCNDSICEILGVCQLAELQKELDDDVDDEDWQDTDDQPIIDEDEPEGEDSDQM